MRLEPQKTTYFKQRGSALLVLLACALATQSASALTLTEALSAAKIHDTSYLAAMTAQQTAQAQRDQAASIWRPKVMLNATIGKGNSETKVDGAQFSTPQMGTSSGVSFNTSVNRGNLTQVAVSAEQPLFNPAKSAQSKQLKLAADISDLRAQMAEQGLVLRVSEYYFDAVLAQNALKLINTELNATQRTATEMKDRFDLGAITVIDLHEANARLAELKATQLAAQTDVQIKERRLRSSIGQVANELSTQPEQLAQKAKLDTLEASLEKAKANNLELQMQSLAVQIAQQQAREYDPASAINLSAVAQLSRQRLTGSGDYGTAQNRENNAMIGVQLSMPLYTGGYRSAKASENQIAAQKAQLELENAEQHMEQSVEAAWLGVQAGALRVNAYDQAKTASHARLDSTIVGVEVGQRTTQDLLNAHNQTAAVVLNAKKAQVDYFMNRLRLLALTHELDTTQIDSMIMRPVRSNTQINTNATPTPKRKQ